MSERALWNKGEIVELVQETWSWEINSNNRNAGIQNRNNAFKGDAFKVR